jgi:hypothetical protein
MYRVCENQRTGLTRSNDYSSERKFGSDVTETADEGKSVIEKEDSVS